MPFQLHFGKQPSSTAYFIGDDSIWWEGALDFPKLDIAKHVANNTVGAFPKTEVAWDEYNNVLYGYCMLLCEPRYRNVRLLFKIIEESKCPSQPPYQRVQ